MSRLYRARQTLRTLLEAHATDERPQPRLRLVAQES
jgi:hypothetical protein